MKNQRTAIPVDESATAPKDKSAIATDKKSNKVRWRQQRRRQSVLALGRQARGVVFLYCVQAYAHADGFCTCGAIVSACGVTEFIETAWRHARLRRLSACARFTPYAMWTI